MMVDDGLDDGLWGGWSSCESMWVKGTNGANKVNLLK
jgi:hypothetical protein